MASSTGVFSAWIFLGGSILFLIQAIAAQQKRLQLSIIANIASAALFIIGSVLFVISSTLTYMEKIKSINAHL